MLRISDKLSALFLWPRKGFKWWVHMCVYLCVCVCVLGCSLLRRRGATQNVDWLILGILIVFPPARPTLSAACKYQICHKEICKRGCIRKKVSAAIGWQFKKLNSWQQKLVLCMYGSYFEKEILMEWKNRNMYVYTLYIMQSWLIYLYNLANKYTWWWCFNAMSSHYCVSYS